MVRLIYEFFSTWGEIEDIHFNSHKCIAFIKYQHRYCAEFAREAMHDQILSEGQTEPISIKWAIDSPFDKSEALRAQQEIEQLQEQNRSRLTRANKNKKTTYLQRHPDVKDPHQALTMEEKLGMKPEDLVPQLMT